MSRVKINAEEFDLLAKYILGISGIALAKGKEYLLETRLSHLISELNCNTFKALYNHARLDATKNLDKRIIDAISTNETYFFRDKNPFELLQHKILPDLIDARTQNKLSSLRTPLRIWSCASSTGQEIYSIAMILDQLNINHNTYTIKLLGTDISDAAIAQASYGKYNKFEIARGLSQDKLHKYFNPEAESWRIKDKLRAMVKFQKINLMKPFVGIGKFDIIFCRNVAIYFNPDDRKRLFNQIANTLEPDGYLIIGSTESITNDTDRFMPHRYLNSTYYQLKG